MDQHEHDEKEDAEKNNDPRDSAEQQRGGDAAAAAAAEGDREQSMADGREGPKAEESPAAGHLVTKDDEVVFAVAGEAESSPVAFLVHPCSLLRLLLRACAGCLGLDGYYCSSAGPKPAAVAAPESAAAAQGGEGGEKANEEVVTRVWAVRTPRPPDRPREGGGGNGGVHH